MKYKKTEGGTGKGKRHSNVNHWEYTEVIKSECKKVRRQMGKRIVRNQLIDLRSDS